MNSFKWLINKFFKSEQPSDKKMETNVELLYKSEQTRQEINATNLTGVMVNQVAGNLSQIFITAEDLDRIGDAFKSGITTELHNSLIEDAIERIDSSIRHGKIKDANLFLGKILGIDGFESLEQNFKTQFYYFKGLVELEENNLDQVIEYAERILSLNSNIKKACELKITVSVRNNDITLFNNAIQKLKEIGTPQNEIMIKHAFFELGNEKFDSVISILTENDVIKKEYVESAEAHHYLGIAFLQKNRTELAKISFEKANSIKHSFYRDYFIILSEIVPILNRRGILLTITNEEKNFLQKKLLELLNIADYFNEKNKELKADFWGHILNIKLFINRSEIFTDIEALPEDIREADIIKLMKAETYAVLGEEEKAVPIYKTLYEKNATPELLLKIISILYADCCRPHYLTAN